MNVQKAFLKEELHDVTFLVGSEEDASECRFPAHKLILSMTSPVFERMLRQDFEEGKSGQIRITDVEPHIFFLLLKYIYNMDFNFVTVQNACQLLIAAQKYLLKPLTEDCVQYLAINVNASTFVAAFRMLSFIEDTGDQKLRQACLKCLEANAKKIFQQSDFCLLSEELLEEIMDFDPPNLPAIEIYNALFNWAKFRCCKKKLTCSVSNIRSTLGDMFYRIPFFNMGFGDLKSGPYADGLLTKEEQEQMSHWYMMEDFVLPEPWNLYSLKRKKGLNNRFRSVQLWAQDDEVSFRKEDTLFVTVRHDVIVTELKFKLKVPDLLDASSFTVSLMGAIFNLEGHRIHIWTYRESFDIMDDEADPFVSVAVPFALRLDGPKAYEFRVKCSEEILVANDEDGVHDHVIETDEEDNAIVDFQCDEDLARSFDTAAKCEEMFAGLNVNEDFDVENRLDSAFRCISLIIVKKH